LNNISSNTIQQNEWSIELLRGIAALMVVLAHYWSVMGIQAGMFTFIYTGVDLFFVISGFVFAPYLFGKKLSTVPHFIRRFFRIYPLYLVALCVYAGLRLYQGQDINFFTEHLLFLHTFMNIFFLDITGFTTIAHYFNPAFWSLPAEVQFYLILPFLAFFTQGNYKNITILIIIALLCHLILAYTSYTNTYERNLFAILNHNIFGLLIEFFLGVIGWFIVGKTSSMKLKIIMLISGMLLWLLLIFTLHELSSSGVPHALRAHPIFRGNTGLFAAVTFTLIVSGFVGLIVNPTNWLKKIAMILGNLSYGLYLFHNAMPTILQSLKVYFPPIIFGVLCFVFTVSISYILHLIYEAPLRNFGRNLANSFNKL
jgi:peptidoglycan/LPS O-acetylase OafA/YrhL